MNIGLREMKFQKFPLTFSMAYMDSAKNTLFKGKSENIAPLFTSATKLKMLIGEKVDKSR